LYSLKTGRFFYFDPTLKTSRFFILIPVKKVVLSLKLNIF